MLIYFNICNYFYKLFYMLVNKYKLKKYAYYLKKKLKKLINKI